MGINLNDFHLCHNRYLLQGLKAPTVVWVDDVRGMEKDIRETIKSVEFVLQDIEHLMLRAFDGTNPQHVAGAWVYT